MKKTIVGILILVLGFTAWKWNRINNYFYFKSKKFQKEFLNFHDHYLRHVNPGDSIATNKKDILAFTEGLGSFLDKENPLLDMEIGKFYGPFEITYLYGVDGKDDHGKKLVFPEITKEPMNSKVKYDVNFFESLFSNYDFVIDAREYTGETFIAIETIVDDEPEPGTSN